jgi:phenylacetyl-CoA:acceptor oxidoreductase
MAKAKAKKGEVKKVPFYCNQCVAGPDLGMVHVRDGVAERIEANFGISEEHPGGGRVCVKAFGLIQKTYNPHRVKQPMKRTNPKKGRDEDPGFVPISWDEAFDIIGKKFREVRAKGLNNDQGQPRLATSTGGGGTPVQYMGTFPAFMGAWGPIDQGYGAGQGVKCYHSEHLYGELWHRSFIVSPDTPYVNYIINCGNNVEASGGVVGIWREADARSRGAKRVQVEPHLSITGAVSAEWVPIKPKTDAAFLFALIHRIIVERGWENVCDVPFLKDRSNSPYLVGPNGYFLRDTESGKPLIFDLADKTAKPYDADISDAALAGSYTVSGVEHGPDHKVWEHTEIEVKPSFQALLDHMAGYTPEWAEEECDVPAERIRQVADEYIAHACVGETIEIEGHTLPFRPVAVMLGKGVNNGWGGYHTCWARTMLAVLVGGLEVPGGTLGTAVKLVRPAASRVGSALPGEDGFMQYQFNATSSNAWMRDPHIRNAYKTLVPLVSDSPWSPALGPAHLPWLFQKHQPDKWPRTDPPDIWICYRTNPAISSWNAPEVANSLAEFPFIIAFAYTEDETNHFADVLLPESTDFESTQLIRIGGTKFSENYWHHAGWAIRSKAIENVHDTMDISDIISRFAEEAGILDEYIEAINNGAAGGRLARKDK